MYCIEQAVECRREPKCCVDCGDQIDEGFEFECMACSKYPLHSGCWHDHLDRKHFALLEDMEACGSS